MSMPPIRLLSLACGALLAACVANQPQDTPQASAGEEPGSMERQAESDLAMSGQPSPDGAGQPASDLAMGPPADLVQPAVDRAAQQGSTDPFGVTRLNPTRNGGREWFLPADATRPDDEWQPDAKVTQVSAGVFHVAGAPRMMVVSPQGKAWWRNVEMTTYVRETGTVNVYGDQEPHWTMFARGERHANDNIAPVSINRGVAAPDGTVTWPGYPFHGRDTINHACLATCYHGLFFPQGKFILEKEIAHTEGYARVAAQTTLADFPHALNRWVGAKFVLRNMNGDKAVKLELWVDRHGDGTWSKVAETTDTGSWGGGNANLNGCTAAPHQYTTTQVVTWAGPWAAFRVDNLSFDFKWMSVREIDPLP